MALTKLFERIFWHNNTTPAINEDNLNSMSKAIDDIDNRVITLGDDVLTIVPQIQAYLEQAEDLVEAMENLSKHPPYIGANGNWYIWDVPTSAFVDSGVDASITVAIADITMLDYIDTPYVTNTGTNTDPIFHLFIPKAATISRVEKTATSGKIDTYTMTLQDGSQFTFTVTNGDGSGDMKAVDYDSNGDVANAGGISDFVDDAINTKMDTDGSNAAREVTFSGAFTVGRRFSGSTVGTNSVAEGRNTTASGSNSHAEGFSTSSTGDFSHAEGTATLASGSNAHAEGNQTSAYNSSHAEGEMTNASGGSHAEGFQTNASSYYSHAEGYGTVASGNHSHAEGDGTTASGNYSHAEGFQTCASYQYSHAEGYMTSANSMYSHAAGYKGRTKVAIGDNLPTVFAFGGTEEILNF